MPEATSEILDTSGDVFDHLRIINPRAAVLLASDYSVDGRATEILKKSCNGFSQKSFNAEEISEKINSILKVG